MKTAEKELWQRRYEQLRQQAVEPDETLAQDRWGLSLLLRKGMAGWMRLWPDPGAGAEGVRACQSVALNCPAPDWQQQATLLLANMALSHCQPLALRPV
ncbi:MAG: hypothetical protein ACLQVW_07160 [Limisphaerales bacterium]|jgi:hypothetical protein